MRGALFRSGERETERFEEPDRARVRGFDARHEAPDPVFGAQMLAHERDGIATDTDALVPPADDIRDPRTAHSDEHRSLHVAERFSGARPDQPVQPELRSIRRPPGFPPLVALRELRLRTRRLMLEVRVELRIGQERKQLAGMPRLQRLEDERRAGDGHHSRSASSRCYLTSLIWIIGWMSV